MMRIRKSYFLTVMLLLWTGSALAQGPTLFFTDLTSGPKTGGENNKGAYVTIYGNNFGAAQGSSTVTVGGGAVAGCPVWGAPHLWYQKITCQLGPKAATGNIVVSIGGQASNGLPFTVRPGAIFFVAPNGNNQWTGSFTAPWRTLAFGHSRMAPGSILYCRQGVVADEDNAYGSPLALSGQNGSQDNEFALVVYPGESCQIGGPNVNRGINTFSQGASYWVISGFKLYFPNSSSAVYIGEGSTHWRLVGLDVSCPNGNGSTGCVTTSENGVPFTKFLGLTIHDSGCPGSMATGPCGDSQKLYHAFYWGDHNGTLLHDVEFGWGDIHNHYGCRGILIHPADDGRAEAYNLTIHDNLIYNTRCDAINIAQTNADKGPVLVYNNVMYHVGTGPDPKDGASDYSCIYTSDFNGKPTTPIEVFNNTCYDAGREAGAGQGDSGAWSTDVPVNYRNNIAYQLAGEAYLTRTTRDHYAGKITGSNNLWFGASSGPAQTKANVNADPLFVNPARADFHLQPGSPAKDAGVAIAPLTFDITGNSRPQGAAYDAGAYELRSAAHTP